MSPNSPAPQPDSLATRLRQLRHVRRAQLAGAENSARELVLVAFGLPVVVVVALTGIVSVTVFAAGGGFAGIGAAVGSAWLAVHQVPLTIAGVTLGALPLLPTLILLALAVKAVAPAIGERRSVYELGALFAASIGGPLLITALAVAVVMDGESVLPVQSPTALVAFGATAALHGVATAIAVIGARWREWLSARGLPAGRIDDIARGTRLGAVAVLALLCAVCVLVVVMLAVRHAAVGRLLGEAHSVDGYLGLLIMSIFYLPNLAVAGAAALVGADVNVGLASLSLLDAHGGAVPPLPLLAVLPDGDLGPLGALGFIVPAAVSCYVGWRCRDVDLRRNLRVVGCAGATAALIMALLTWAGSGDLGELGAFGAGVPVVGVFTFAVIGVPGLVIALVTSLTPAAKAARASGADFEFDDVDDDGYDDSYVDDSYVDGYYDTEDDAGYHEYYVDDLDPEVFDPDDFPDGPTARIPAQRQSPRGMSRDDYEDVDFIDSDYRPAEETEVTSRRS